MHTHSIDMIKRYLLAVLILGAAWAGQSLAIADSASSPRELIISTTERLVAALQENKDAIRQDIDKAYRLADDTVIPHLDFPRITRWVVGKHWRTANDEQRERLVSEFRTLLTRSYVSAMVTYVDKILDNANNVQYPPARSQESGNDAAVTMLIMLEAGKEATVQYQLYRTDAGWKIYDVKVEGISLALTYRSSFSEEISRTGIDGLIATLVARNQEAHQEPLPQVR